MDEINDMAAALKPRERVFCEEYTRDFNATAAVLRAGWNQSRPAAANTGSKLMRKPEVRAYLDALLRERAESAGAGKDSVVSRLLDVAQRCMQAEPVLEWNSETHAWEPSGEYKFDAKGAVNALTQLSKMLGYDSNDPACDAPDTYAIGFEAEAQDDGE